MKKQYFMLDLESTGTDIHQDEILQICILEVLREGDGLWEPGRRYTRLLGSNRQPRDPFAVQYMAPLYAECNALYALVGRSPAHAVHAEVRGFLDECGVTQPAMFMGKNLVAFDLPFCVESGYLKGSFRDPVTNEIGGDTHYRSYEIMGAIEFMTDLTGKTRKELEMLAAQMKPNFDFPPHLLQKGSHDAEFDCYAQLAELNAFIRLARGEKP